MKKYYFGSRKRQNYYESWYFKHVFGNETVIFIPGICYTEEKQEAYIRVIINNESTYIPYSLDQFYAKEDELFIQIGGNIFTKRGCRICIHKNGLSLDGVIRYGRLNGIRYNAMGPISLIPFNQCSYSVISMDHALYGVLQNNDHMYSLNEGRGFIAAGHGKKLPNNYIWTQCNNFKRPFTSIIVSVADVDLKNVMFEGVIAIVWYKGREYRFATYLGAKLHACTKNKIVITQNDMILKVYFKDKKVHYFFAVNSHALINEKTVKAVTTSKMDANHFLP